jgi:hypothetical protein
MMEGFERKVKALRNQGRSRFVLRRGQESPTSAKTLTKACSEDVLMEEDYLL